MWKAKWISKWRLLFTLLCVTPLLSGCWDRLEAEQRATVLGISIDMEQKDQAEQSSSSDLAQTDATLSRELPTTSVKGVMKLTAQIAVPGRIPLGPGEGGGGGSDSPSKTVWIVQSRGKTLNDALQQLQQKVADKLFLGHLRVIVVSEAYAQQQGMEGITDTLRRNSQVRRTAWLVVSKGQAADLMATAPPLERVPTLYLMSTLDHARQMGKMSNDFFGVFASRLTMKGREPVLPYVQVLPEKNVNTTGLALFKGDKMVASTQKTFDIATYMQLDGNPTGGYAIMVQLPGQTGTIMWQAYRTRRKIAVDIRNGRPHFRVDIRIDGNIIGKSDEQISLDNPKSLRAIDQELVRQGRSQLNDFIDQTRRNDTDVAGFGEYVRARERVFWDKNIKTKAAWERMYPSILVDTTVEIRTHRVGMQGK